MNVSVRLATTLSFLFISSGTLAQSSADYREAEVDCRAGCQGDAKKCQQSLTGEARIDAAPGRYFDVSTLKIVARRNASDSPGLIRDPQWATSRVPPDASQPSSVIVRPIVATCEGKSKDTQGVTFYTWRVSYFPK